MSRRERSNEFEKAPRVWIGNQVVSPSVNDPIVNLTGLVPTLAEADGAPFVDLHLTFVIVDPLVGPRGMVTDDAALNNTAHATYFRYPATAGRARVVIKKLRPRANAAATTLLDGTYVAVYSDDPNNGYDVNVAFAVPSLNWRNRS